MSLGLAHYYHSRIVTVKHVKIAVRQLLLTILQMLPWHKWKDNVIVGFKKWMERYGLDASDSEQGPVTDSCEHDNELSGCKKSREFLD
jgi:hypothetical protein